MNEIGALTGTTLPQHGAPASEALIPEAACDGHRGLGLVDSRGRAAQGPSHHDRPYSEDLDALDCAVNTSPPDHHSAPQDQKTHTWGSRRTARRRRARIRGGDRAGARCGRERRGLGMRTMTGLNRDRKNDYQITYLF
jgi:hypothetical protein